MRLNAKTLQAVADALRKRTADQNAVAVDLLLPWDDLAEPERRRWVELALAAIRAYDEATEGL